MPYTDAIYSSPVVNAASDATYAVQGDAYDGLPTKVTPTGGEIAQGARPDHQLAAEHDNWTKSQIGQFLGALKADGQQVYDLVTATITKVVGLALNFVGNSGAAEFSTTARAAYFDLESKTWYVCGTSGLAKATSDMGATWRDVLLGETKSLNGIATNAYGTVVYCTSGRYVQVAQDLSEENPLTGQYDCFGVLPGNIASSIAFSHGLFCCVGDSAASPGLKIRTSPDGNTWTTRTVPAGWGNGDPKLYRKPSPTGSINGRLILAALSYADGRTVSCSHSDDGGITWSATTTFVLALVSGTTSYSAIGLGYDAIKDRFLLVGRRPADVGLSSHAKSIHYASTDDGSTWTQVGPGLHNSGIGKPGCIGGVWVAMLQEWNVAGVSDIRSSLAYSLDDGATWKRSGHAFYPAGAVPGAGAMLLSTDIGVWEGAGGLLVLTYARAYLTARQGEPGLPAAT